MDFDSFLTSPRWEILQIIAEKPSSPVEIAQKLNTTVSYASQQLKLLDAAGLLNKEKTGAAEKGKPRTLFSLSNELLYLTVLTKELSEKKLIYLTDYHRTILKIWMLKDLSLHYFIEKLYWKLEEDLDEIEAIFVEETDEARVIIVSDSKKVKTKIETFSKKLEKKIDFSFVTKTQLKKISSKFLTPLYDPKNILENLKGGILEDNE
jgi:predicted transcriptional regulator